MPSRIYIFSIFANVFHGFFEWIMRRIKILWCEDCSKKFPTPSLLYLHDVAPKNCWPTITIYEKKTENHIDGEPFCFSQSILLRSSQHIRGNLFYFDVCSWKWMLCYREEETVWDCCVKGNNSAKLRLLYMNIFKALFVHNEKCFSSVR